MKRRHPSNLEQFACEGIGIAAFAMITWIWQSAPVICTMVALVLAIIGWRYAKSRQSY
jgi:hypothetical protein